MPGSQVSGASWSGTTAVSSCCSLVSIQNISGVTLLGRQSYFLVVAAGIPLTSEYWMWNNQGATVVGGLGEPRALKTDIPLLMEQPAATPPSTQTPSNGPDKREMTRQVAFVAFPHSRARYIVRAMSDGLVR